MREELPMAAGGIGRPALWALQETLIQEAGDFRGGRGTMRVGDSETLELQAVVGAGLGETGVWLLLEHRTNTLSIRITRSLLKSSRGAQEM